MNDHNLVWMNNLSNFLLLTDMAAFWNQITRTWNKKLQPFLNCINHKSSLLQPGCWCCESEQFNCYIWYGPLPESGVWELKHLSKNHSSMCLSLSDNSYINRNFLWPAYYPTFTTFYSPPVVTLSWLPCEPWIIE